MEEKYLTIKLTNASIATIRQVMLNNKNPELTRYAQYEEVSFTYQKDRVDLGGWQRHGQRQLGSAATLIDHPTRFTASFSKASTASLRALGACPGGSRPCTASGARLQPGSTRSARRQPASRARRRAQSDAQARIHRISLRARPSRQSARHRRLYQAATRPHPAASASAWPALQRQTHSWLIRSAGAVGRSRASK